MPLVATLGVSTFVVVAVSVIFWLRARRRRALLLELLRVASASFLRGNFSDVDGVFDYRLRAGTCTIGNAIATLGRIGYPRHIVEDATRRLDQLPS